MQQMMNEQQQGGSSELASDETVAAEFPSGN
jgi:hypothetical protein